MSIGYSTDGSVYRFSSHGREIGTSPVRPTNELVAFLSGISRELMEEFRDIGDAAFRIKIQGKTASADGILAEFVRDSDVPEAS